MDLRSPYVKGIIIGFSTGEETGNYKGFNAKDAKKDGKCAKKDIGHETKIFERKGEWGVCPVR